MGKVRVSLSEYRRRRGLSVTELPKLLYLGPQTGTPDTLFPDQLAADSSPLTQLPTDFDRLLEQKPAGVEHIFEEEAIQQHQQPDEQHGPRTPSEPPDDDEEEDEEEVDDLNIHSPLHQHNRSPTSAQLPPPPLRSQHQFNPVSFNGQHQKSHSLDLTDVSSIHRLTCF